MAGLKFNFNEIAKFESFAKEAGRELRKSESVSALNDPTFIETIQEFIKDSIAENLVNKTGAGEDRFGLFMAKRTLVSVEPKDKILHIKVEGMLENDLASVDPDEARVSEGSNPANNLWEMYEFGGFDASDKTKNTESVVKDVGGVVAIRNGSNRSSGMDGARAGMVRSILQRVRTELKLRIQSAAANYARFVIAASLAEAGDRARKVSTGRLATRGGVRTGRVSGINRLPNNLRGTAKRNIMAYQTELSKLNANVSISRSGGSVQVRLHDARSGKFKAMPVGFKERILGKGI